MLDPRSLSLVLSASLVSAGLAAAPAEPQLLGEKIPDLRLLDLEGKEWSLHAQTGKKALVVAMLSTGCPMAKAYLPDLAEVSRRFSERGVLVVGVHTDPEETAAEVAAQAKEYATPFPLVLDAAGRAVEALKAEVSSEVFVLDGGFVLRYRGRVDDGYSARLRRKSVAGRRDLEMALEEVLAGKPVSVPATKALGCTLRRRALPAAGKAEVTFNREVMPILQRRCQECHRPGEVGPFSLLSYRDAVRWGEDMVDVARARKMPPWKPTGTDGLFQDERRMSEEEIKLLEKWVAAGMPEGDPSDLPPPVKFPDGWRLGEPDLVLEVPEEMTLAATGPDLFRVFVIPTGLEEDRYVSAIEVRPGNRRAVHHTLQFYDTRGRGRQREARQREKDREKPPADQGPGYTEAMGVGFNADGGLGGWAPGNLMRRLPDGIAYRLSARSDLLVQVHYHRTGKVEKDRLRLGLHFATKPVKQRLRTFPVAGFLLSIPAGEERFRVRGAFEVEEDSSLLQLTPHMHLLGKEIEATLLRPDGSIETLIAIRDWDYNWQETYRFEKPIAAPTGSHLLVEAFYDNSEKNPLNPHSPPRDVIVGEQTTDEMCFVFIAAVGKAGVRPKAKPTLSNRPWQLLEASRKKGEEKPPPTGGSF